MPYAKRHHFVPQFLLRRFAKCGDRKLFVFDKKTDRVFRTNVANVAVETKLYEFEVGDFIVSAEAGLAQFETRAAQAVDRILSADSLADMGVEDRVVLSAFVGLLILRSPHQRAIMRHLIEQLRQKVSALGTDPDSLPELKVLSEAEEKALLTRTFSTTLKKLAPIIALKTWVLHAANQNANVYISDNPVAIHNS
jgi:hypothetical protein